MGLCCFMGSSISQKLFYTFFTITLPKRLCAWLSDLLVIFDSDFDFSFLQNKVFPKSSNTLEYDIRKEGDPFKAPHPILAVDPLWGALTMISCGEDSSQSLCELPDLEPLQSGQHLLNEAFYDYEQDLMMKSATYNAT